MKPKDRTAMLAMLALLPLVLVRCATAACPARSLCPGAGRRRAARPGFGSGPPWGRCWPCCPGWSGGNSAGPLRLPPWSSCMS